MNKYKTVLIIVIIFTAVGGAISLFLDYSNSTIPIPLNPEKMDDYLKQGCTERAIAFINNKEQVIDDFSSNDFPYDEVDICLKIITKQR